MFTALYKKRKFKQRIAKIYDRQVDCQVGLCSRIRSSMGERALLDFIRYFKPTHCTEQEYWYGLPTSNALPKRLAILQEFKELAIKNKLYKKY